MGWNRNDRALRQSTRITVISGISGVVSSGATGRATQNDRSRRRAGTADDNRGPAAGLASAQSTEWLTAKEAAAYLKVKHRTVCKWATQESVGSLNPPILETFHWH
jgi:hypothetical protein